MAKELLKLLDLSEEDFLSALEKRDNKTIDGRKELFRSVFYLPKKCLPELYIRLRNEVCFTKEGEWRYYEALKEVIKYVTKPDEKTITQYGLWMTLYGQPKHGIVAALMAMGAKDG